MTPDQMRSLLTFDTCAIANAIERVGVRMRNEGFTTPGLLALSSKRPLLGYAACCKFRSANPPTQPEGYHHRGDWWDEIERTPFPRVAVAEDVDPVPGLGASVGEVHAAVLMALGCRGFVTNGAARDLSGLERLDFPVLAATAAVSHAYAHLVEVGRPVRVFGLGVRPGSLLFGDRHGLLELPEGALDDVLRIAKEQAGQERVIVDFCRVAAAGFEASGKLPADFSKERLREMLAAAPH